VEGVETRPVTIDGDKIHCQVSDYSGLNRAADPEARTPSDFDEHFNLWPRRYELMEAEANLMQRILVPFCTVEKLKEKFQKTPQKQHEKTPREKKVDTRLKGFASLSTAFSGDAASGVAQDKYRVDFPVYFYDLLRIANIHTCDGQTVSYPKADAGGGGQNSTASHQWFIGNRQMGAIGDRHVNASGIAWAIKYTLPEMTVKPYSSQKTPVRVPDLTLPKLEKYHKKNLPNFKLIR
jgi:hypothetical protein